jgi:RNA polymerase sigma factor FliA
MSLEGAGARAASPASSRLVAPNGALHDERRQCAPSQPAPRTDGRLVLLRIQENLDLVDKITNQLHRQVRPSFTYDELASFGREGLLKAARSFNPDRGVPFRCWATMRIRGTIIDGVRTTAILPRRAYRRLRALEAANEMQDGPLEFDATKRATPRVAEQVLEEYIAGIATAMAIGFITGSPRENLDEEGHEVSPEDVIGRSEFMRQVRKSIARLPNAERRIVERHYFDDLTVDEAARELGKSKSWGSRLHARAIAFLARDMRRAGFGTSA